MSATTSRRKDQPTSLERGPQRSVRARIDELQGLMEAAASQESSKPINMNLPSHRVITEAFHGCVFGPGVPAVVPMCYADQSHNQVRITEELNAIVKAKPDRRTGFPIHVLAMPSESAWRDDDVFNLGTLTFRHADYDNCVDYYLVRDRETRRLNMAQLEALAYERMAALLLDQELQRDSYVKIYHTGLEPLVIGIYRALVDALYQRRQDGPALLVRPVFTIRESGEVCGQCWGTPQRGSDD